MKSIKIYDDMISCTNWEQGVERVDTSAISAATIVFAEALERMEEWEDEEIDMYLIDMLHHFGEYTIDTEYICEDCGHTQSKYYWEIPIKGVQHGI